MSISVSDSAFNFGDVQVGESATTTITYRNSGATAESLTLSTGDPFSVSPASGSVPPGGELTVTVKFSPTQASGANQTLTAQFTGGPATTALSGAGISPVAADTTVAAGTHLLIKVPDFTNAKFERANDQEAVEESMTSYLRMGTFDFDQESDRARELLDLIPKALPATNPYGLTSDVAIIEGRESGTIFADDVRTRAQDTTRIGVTNAEYGQNDPNLSTEDDPGNKLTAAQRQDESSRLYSRGGWRDHSDGNRISTTYGDKVEVVRGNYKMIVMGRQDNTDEAMGWEASGSHIQDYAPGTMPGASFWLEWINDPRYYAPSLDDDGKLIEGETSQKGVWLLVNTTQNVYEYARYAGNFREERWGDVLETYIGSENPPARGTFALDNVEGTKGHEPPVRLPDRNYDLPEEAGGDNASRNVPLFSEDNVGTVRSNPHIIEKTWATRYDSFLGTQACKVDYILEEHHANSYDETVRVTNKFKTDFKAKNFEEVFKATDSIDEERRAPTINTKLFAGNVFELFVGNHNEVFLGATQSLKIGGFLDVTFGAAEVNFDASVFRTEIAIASKKVGFEGNLSEFKAEIGAQITKLRTPQQTVVDTAPTIEVCANQRMRMQAVLLELAATTHIL